MAGTAFLRKHSQHEREKRGGKEVRSNKRRKVNTGSSTAAVKEPKSTVESKSKKSTKQARSIAKLFKLGSKKPQPSMDSLVDIYYFNAPQERNSVEELGIWEQPTAEPEELQALLEDRAVGMTDADKAEEREERLRESQRHDEMRFERRSKLYGEDVAKAYVTPGWNAYVPTIGQDKLLREVAAVEN